MCPRGLLGPPAVTLAKQLKYEKETSTEMYTGINVRRPVTHCVNLRTLAGQIYT